MSYTISNLRDDVTPKLHDNGIDKLSGEFNDKVWEAARNLLNKIDPATTIRKMALSNALYDNVYSYIAPADLKGTKVISLLPQPDALTGQDYRQTGYSNFGVDKEIGTLVVEHDSGIKTISIAGYGRAGLTLSTGNSITENGTWTVGGQADALTLDNYIYVNAGSSLRFNMTTGGTTGYLENTLTSPIDYDAYNEISAFFVWVYIPSTDLLESFSLRWGSSDSDYFTATVTNAHDNTAFKVGWNLVRFDWNTATEIGTVTNTSIDYIRFTVTLSEGADINGFRLNAIVGRIGQPYDLRYYSKYLFRTEEGVWLEKPENDTDIINLDTESYNVLMYELMYAIAQEMQGEDSGFDISFFTVRRKEAYENYSGDNKSQAKKPQKSYYRMRPGRSRGSTRNY